MEQWEVQEPGQDGVGGTALARSLGTLISTVTRKPRGHPAEPTASGFWSDAPLLPQLTAELWAHLPGTPYHLSHNTCLSGRSFEPGSDLLWCRFSSETHARQLVAQKSIPDRSLITRTRQCTYLSTYLSSIIYQSVYGIFLFICHPCIVFLYPFRHPSFQHLHPREEWEGGGVSLYTEPVNYPFVIGILQLKSQTHWFYRAYILLGR